MADSTYPKKPAHLNLQPLTYEAHALIRNRHEPTNDRIVTLAAASRIIKANPDWRIIRLVNPHYNRF